MFANWEEVFESFSEIAKDKICADDEIAMAMTLLMNIGVILGRFSYWQYYLYCFCYGY